MTADLTLWIVAAAASAAALLLFARFRGATLQASQRQLEVEKLQAELVAARKQLEKAAAKQRRGAEEMAELRRRLEKTKKRAAQGHAAAGGTVPSRHQELEDALEQTRQARDAAREETSALSAELSRLRAEHARPAPSEPPAPEPVAVDTQALEARAAAAEAKLEALREELAQANKAGSRLRNKVATQESLYLAMRGELDAKKDRLRRQHEELERLRAFKVAVVDPLPAQTLEREPAQAESAVVGASAESSDGEAAESV